MRLRDVLRVVGSGACVEIVEKKTVKGELAKNKVFSGRCEDAQSSRRQDVDPYLDREVNMIYSFADDKGVSWMRIVIY
jgi:hypothetical protein